MKILSRADHIKREFIEFLFNNNLALDDGKKYQYLNPLPHTLKNAIIIDSDSIFLKCYGTSFCEEDAALENKYVGYTDSLILDGVSLYANNKFYVHGLPSARLNVIQLLKDGEIFILFPREITSIQIYSEHEGNVTSHSIKESLEFRNTIATTISSGHTVLSLLFYNPVIVRCPNRKVCIVCTPSRNVILSLLNEPIIGLVRRYYLTRFITKMIIGLNIETPLIEFLDYTTISLPITFSGNCIRLAIFNLLHRSANSIIKSYRYITKIVLDSVTEYNYRHSIIRIGLPPYSRTEFELCIHTL